MSDLFHRLNPFGRPASPTKPRSASPTKLKRTKSPHNLHPDRPESPGGYLASRPSSSLEAPVPDVPSGRYLFDTQQSIDLDRPVFTPDQAYQSTTPGRRARTPSILRSLAHHPSLSALKSKQKRHEKKREEGPSIDEGDREERLSGSVDDEVPGQEEDDEVERRGWMGTWGSAKKKKRARKGSLKAVKSMPSVRSSGESEGDYRPSIDAPVPALPDMYVKRASRGGIDFSKARAADIEISLEGYDEPVSPTRIAPRTSVSPSPILRIRGQSVDFSPRRQASLPRHVSTPPSGKRGFSISPPRLSLPSTTQHPHPIPLEWERGDSLDVEEYDAAKYGDRCRTPDIGLDDGLDLLHQAEELPHGTPGGTKEEMQRGILSDVAKHEKGAVRFFFRDTYARLSESPSDSPRPSPCATPTSASVPPSFTDRANRSESPFEVILSAMVSKRMSLDAFGLTPAIIDDDKRESMQSVPESVEEIEDEEAIESEFEVDEGEGEEVPGRLELVNTLEGWTGTQLTTIDESPGSTRSAAFMVLSTPTTSTSLVEAGRTTYYTPESRSHPSSPLKYSPGPASISRQLIEAHTEHTRSLDAQVRENAATIEVLQKEVEALKVELEDESRENEAAWRVVDDVQLDLKKAESNAEERQQALEQMRQAMVENEDIFDHLQESHDHLAERVERMELALSHAVETRERQAEQISILTQANLDLPLDLASRSSEKADLETQLQQITFQLNLQTSERAAGTRQLEVTTEEFTSHMASCEVRMAEISLRASEVDAMRSLVSLRESELEACRLEVEELRAAKMGLERKVADGDMVLQQWRDKVTTKQFEVDEGRIKAEVEVREVREALKVVEGERDELLEKLQHASTAADQPEHIQQLEEDAGQLEAELDDARFLLEEAQDQLESARSDLEARDGDMSLQQGEIEQTRAELDAAQESLARMTAQSTRVQREHERTLSDLHWQLDDIRTQLVDQETQVRVAFVEREISSATTADVQSRLTAYLSEIDRLKVSEARLAAEVTDLRSASGAETLRVTELEKRVRELEEDKELMDISLDNKETEITLLHRQASRVGGGAVSVTPTRKRLGASMSRRSSISIHGTGQGTSSVQRPASAAAGSTSSVLKMSRRESLVLSTPKPKAPTPALPASSTLHRRSSITTPTPSSRILGTTTKHNRSMATGVAFPRKSTSAVSEPTIKRQTSLPAIVRVSSVSRTGHRALGGMAEVDERGMA